MCIKCGKLVHCKYASKKTPVKKALTDEDVKREFISLINSCAKGYTGEWDSTGEGRDGFEAMYHGLKKLAAHYGVKVGRVKQI